MREQSNPPVPAHPVVAVEVRGREAFVNGEALENPQRQDPHELAVHHVALWVAGTLNRPVRVRAVDETGTMSLIVHPDAQVSGLLPLSTPTPPTSTPMADAVGDTGGVQKLYAPSGEHGPEELGVPGTLDDLLAPLSRERVLATSARQKGRRYSSQHDSNGERSAGWCQRPLFADETPDRPHLRGHDSTREWSTAQSAPVPGRRALRGPDWSVPEPAGELAGGLAGGLAGEREQERSPGQGRPHLAGEDQQPSAASSRPRLAAGAGGKFSDALPTVAAEASAYSAQSFLTRHQAQPVAQTGWRGALTRMGLATAPSDRERSQRDCVHAISRHWPGPRTIAIVNGKGGAGKTPTTVVLASLFARHGGAGILAWDNNETRGTLGWRTEQGPHEAHVLTMLPFTERLMEPTARSADLAAYVHHQTEDKYDVLRSNPQMLASEQRLTAQDFDAVHQVASKYFRLIFVDSGNDETAPHWRRMIDHADQLVVATTTRPDHAEAGRLLLDALRQRDERSARLADQAVVVVSQADREEASADEIAAGFRDGARAALTVPYDRALRAPWLRFNALHSVTQDAYLRAAAAVSEGL